MLQVRADRPLEQGGCACACLAEETLDQRQLFSEVFAAAETNSIYADDVVGSLQDCPNADKNQVLPHVILLSNPYLLLQCCLLSGRRTYLIILSWHCRPMWVSTLATFLAVAAVAAAEVQAAGIASSAGSPATGARTARMQAAAAAAAGDMVAAAGMAAAAAAAMAAAVGQAASAVRCCQVLLPLVLLLLLLRHARGCASRRCSGRLALAQAPPKVPEASPSMRMVHTTATGPAMTFAAVATGGGGGGGGGGGNCYKCGQPGHFASRCPQNAGGGGGGYGGGGGGYGGGGGGYGGGGWS